MVCDRSRTDTSDGNFLNSQTITLRRSLPNPTFTSQCTLKSLLVPTARIPGSTIRRYIARSARGAATAMGLLHLTVSPLRRLQLTILLTLTLTP